MGRRDESFDGSRLSDPFPRAVDPAKQMLRNYLHTQVPPSHNRTRVIEITSDVGRQAGPYQSSYRHSPTHNLLLNIIAPYSPYTVATQTGAARNGRRTTDTTQTGNTQFAPKGNSALSAASLLQLMPQGSSIRKQERTTS